MRMVTKKTGFTLVELSVVLIIIGLIVGGVMVGNALIDRAKVLAVGNDFQKYKSAIDVFYLRYNALPGDISNATDFWPTAAGNGNGDGSYLNAPRENVRAWNHLGLSGIIAGKYVGTANNDKILELNIDVPGTVMDGVGFIIRRGTSYSGKVGSEIEVGKPRIIGADYHQMSRAAFTNLQSMQIDNKFDDGIANTGRIRGHGEHDTGTCTGSIYNATPGNDYDLTNTTVACYLKFYLDDNAS